MGKNIIYIAGPMAGTEDMGRAKFKKAEAKLMAAGFHVLNPAVLPMGLPEECYMPICLAMLEQADGIYLLKGWENSVGALLEYLHATKIGKAVYIEGVMEP